ncbi:addiction module protein [Reyranella sp.]|uniref:addiction module protein n=1 Tax=Reyranella sp. TaxID=1929291 RepID=UPI003D09A147
MAQPSLDPAALTVEERLRLIEDLWLSIEKDAEIGDSAAIEALGFDDKIDPELLAEMERRVEAFKRDPSRAIRWEDLRAELQQKYG